MSIAAIIILAAMIGGMSGAFIVVLVNECKNKRR